MEGCFSSRHNLDVNCLRFLVYFALQIRDKYLKSVQVNPLGHLWIYRVRKLRWILTLLDSSESSSSSKLQAFSYTADIVVTACNIPGNSLLIDSYLMFTHDCMRIPL